MNMDTSGGIIACWILATLMIFASLQRSEAIRWTKQPKRPKVLVEGVNNTEMSLAWDFVLDSGEIVQNVLFQREKPGDITPTTLASRLASSSFTFLNNAYVNDYKAERPNTLILRNVNNNEEYIYSMVVNYVKNNVVQTPFKDQVEVIVYVPPRITIQPARKSEVDAGQNLMLTCSADGDPKPNIIWTKDGVPQNQFNSVGSPLHLVDIQGKDVGSYRCTASNGCGTATSIAFVNINCPLDQCQVLHVGITITNVEWKDAFASNISVEHKMLASNLSSAISRLYSLPQNVEKKLLQLNIVKFRRGSTVAIVQLQFQNDVLDPLKPLHDDVTDGNLGTFKVATELDLNPISAPGTQRPPTSGADLKSPIIRAIVGGTILLVVIRALIN